MDRLKRLLAEYGPVAIWLYMALFFGVLFGSYVAIQAGWRPEGAAGNLGAWAAAYIVTKLTQPLRIGATVLLTPLAAKIHRRRSPPPFPAPVHAAAAAGAADPQPQQRRP